MNWSAADRARPTPWDAIVLLAVLAVAGILFFLLLPKDGNFLTAQIVLDQEVVAEIPLSSLTETITFEVPGVEYPMVLEAEPGRIHVAHSDCPSEDCVHTGWISRSGGPIVCLPNRLIITITGSDLPLADAVTG